MQRDKAQQLSEGEYLFRHVFENAADAILIADQEGRYIEVNPCACRMLGYTRHELLTKRLGDLTSDEDKQRLEEVRRYLLESSEHVRTDEWKLKHKNGKYVPVEASARILADGRWLAITRDISERKQIQDDLARHASEIRDLYDNAPCGYHSIDRDGVFTRVNQTELNWLGYSREELIGKKNVKGLLTPKSQKTFEATYPTFLAGHNIDDMEMEFVRKDGTVFPVLLSASAILDEHGQFIASRTTLFNMTERAEAEKRLRLAATVFEHTNDAIIVTDAEGTIVAVNTAFTRITGYTPDEVIGKNPRLLHSGLQQPSFYQHLWDALKHGGIWQGEIWNRRKTGDFFPAWESITAVKDESNRITEYISIFSDITAIKETEQKLARLAYHDSLTGLSNRLMFNERITQVFAHARRHHIRAALLLLDLDRFKLINDTLGHAAGDHLLQIVALRLKETIREEDTVARLGGDEFAVLLTSIESSGDAAIVAEKLIRIVCDPVSIANHVLTVSTSIGISIFPDDGGDSESLYKAADMALYDAKSKGRRGYQFYTSDMTKIATDTLMIDRGLRDAIRRSELVLHYQPQVSLTTGRIVGFEALVRWNSAEHGMMQPAEFIHVAEETDLIESLGEWVIDTALAQLERWRIAGAAPVRMAVNLSPRQIKQPGFVSNMRRKLLACRFTDGFSLDIEVTESVLQTEPDTVAALKELKGLGLTITIDDFGTGYSCLNSLKHLPVDVLKIDRSFIDGIPGDKDDMAITASIIAMGHNLGMAIIAEGIETRGQFDFVLQQHCDQGQGFLFSPPLDADSCERMLMSNKTLFFTGAGVACQFTNNIPADVTQIGR
jgi:diguanylate cyclase (GGDEF)-like protein/PAS domain S-box-containing protein